MKIKEIYWNLLKLLGKQNWWPVRFKNKIDKDYDYRVEIIVGAILTQNNKWEIVERVINNYNKINYTLDYFLDKDDFELYNIFKGIVFLKRKIKTIKELFKYIKEKYGCLDNFGKLDENEMRKELLKIYGIGKETADDIILYAFNKKTFPVDKYTILLFKRLNVIDKDDYEYIKDLVLREINNIEELKEFHALIDIFFKNYCKKNRCNKCPFKKYCNIYLSNTYKYH